MKNLDSSHMITLNDNSLYLINLDSKEIKEKIDISNQTSYITEIYNNDNQKNRFIILISKVDGFVTFKIGQIESMHNIIQK